MYLQAAIKRSVYLAGTYPAMFRLFRTKSPRQVVFLLQINFYRTNGYTCRHTHMQPCTQHFVHSNGDNKPLIFYYGVSICPLAWISFTIRECGQPQFCLVEIKASIEIDQLATKKKRLCAFALWLTWKRKEICSPKTWRILYLQNNIDSYKDARSV